MAAVAAAHAGEPAGEEPAVEVAGKLALDEVGKPGAVGAALARFAEEGSEVLPDGAMQDGGLGLAAKVAPGSGARDTPGWRSYVCSSRTDRSPAAVPVPTARPTRPRPCPPARKQV